VGPIDHRRTLVNKLGRKRALDPSDRDSDTKAPRFSGRRGFHYKLQRALVQMGGCRKPSLLTVVQRREPVEITATAGLNLAASHGRLPNVNPRGALNRSFPHRCAADWGRARSAGKIRDIGKSRPQTGARISLDGRQSWVLKAWASPPLAQKCRECGFFCRNRV
jgi:hypothetical protein